MRKLATIVTVETVQPVPESDNLDVITLHGRFWRLVVGRDSVKCGERGVYFEIDSVLPEEPPYEFLRSRCFTSNELNRGFRIRTVTLRKQISQGLFIPFGGFPVAEYGELHKAAESEPDGFDLTELLRVKLYENPNEGCQTEDAIGQFPHFIMKTDQERLQNLPDYFSLYRDEDFEVTVKLDGSSHTVAWHEGEFIVCSRNLQKVYDNDAPQGDFSVLIKEQGWFDKLRQYNRSIAVQGEFVGPGIQRNRAKFQCKEFFVFDIWDIEHQRYLSAPERVATLTALFGNTDCMVPVVKESCKILAEYPTFNALMDLADTTTIRNTPAEGIVCKMISDPMISFKVISNKYLLKDK
ncbi:MAG: RNA ligase family protein [Thermoguttaceae bacterium]